MARLVVITHPDGTQTTVRSRTGCGCGPLLWLVLGAFVVIAPAYYAVDGRWPLGWAGALVCYIVEALIVVAALTRSRGAPSA